MHKRLFCLIAVFVSVIASGAMFVPRLLPRKRTCGSMPHVVGKERAALRKGPAVPSPRRSICCRKLVTRSVMIQVAGGEYPTTGSQNMPAGRLELMRQMRPGVEVRIVGAARDGQPIPRFAWEDGGAMVLAVDGNWSLENVQIGTGTTRQRRGAMATGSGAAHAQRGHIPHAQPIRRRDTRQRGGLILLRGAIRINENMHDSASQESFAGIVATDHGTIRFADTENASLDMGNGSLSASYYGCIALGCKTARITSWGEQSNTLAINNGGRIDLRNTTTTLVAKQKRNTPIGLEHDGHILAEGARIIIEGENEMAIALQKASTLTCNDIELRGKFAKSLWASSGSMFVGRFRTDVNNIEADTSRRSTSKRSTERFSVKSRQNAVPSSRSPIATSSENNPVLAPINRAGLDY